jgi:hypothetical protein
MRPLFVGNHRKRTALPYAAEASLLTGFVILESSLAPSPSNIRTIAPCTPPAIHHIRLH